MFVLLLLISLCIVKLNVLKPYFEETSVWISILSRLAGYIFTKSKTMNKTISTQDRVFRLWQNRINFQNAEWKHILHKLNYLIFLYRKMQQIYIKMEKTLTFKKYANLEFLNSPANCLLIIDNSCEEKYNDKKFAKLATRASQKH